MLKILSAAMLLLASSFLWCQELVVEQYPEQTKFFLLVPYNNINFRAGTEESQYQLSIQIRNNRGRSVFTHGETVRFYKRTWLVNTAIPYEFSQNLPAGAYQMQIRLRNRNVGGNLELRKTFRISDQATERGQAYIYAQRDSIRYIPQSIPARETLQALTLIQSFSVQPDSIRLICGSSSFSLPGPSNHYIFDLLDWEEFNPDHELKIIFHELNIQYRMEPFLYSQWFAYGQTYSLRDQINQIRYIATQNEWQVLRRVSNDQLAEAIEQFWTLHDPSPGTLRNETRELFYQRVMIADERYTIHSRLKGWRSDRGRIYIKYGEPDEIRAEALPLDSPPYIIWQYYSRNVQFEFVDEGGFGRYTLRNTEDEY